MTPSDRPLVVRLVRPFHYGTANTNRPCPAVIPMCCRPSTRNVIGP